MSDRFIRAADGDPFLAFALLHNGAPPPEWHVNAVRDHERMRNGLANAGVTLEADTGQLHDLGGAWDGLQRTLLALGTDDANVFEAGTPLGDDEQAEIRVLSSAEASAALTALETVERAVLENAMRRALAASRTPREQRRNPFTGEMQSIGRRGFYGVGVASDDEIVAALTKAFEQLRAILREARDRRFGLAIQIVV